MNFHVLRAELAQNVETIKKLLAGVTQEEAQQKPDAENWSILEVVCHLYDEECEDFRQRLDIILHRPDEPWPPIHPVAWVTERNYNEQNLAEMLEKWVQEREKSLEWLDGLGVPDWDREAPSPFGFNMKAGDMLSAWAAHDILHLRQLVELRYMRVGKLTAPYDIQYAGEW